MTLKVIVAYNHVVVVQDLVKNNLMVKGLKEGKMKDLVQFLGVKIQFFHQNLSLLSQVCLVLSQNHHIGQKGRFKDLKATNSCTSKAFNSMVFIIVELQTYALHMRESMCNEDLEMIIDKVQGDIVHSASGDQTYLKVHYPDIVPQDESKVVWSDEEKELWDSIQDETLNMRGLKGIGFDHEVMSKFVSPLSVEIEPDNSVDYYKADLVYQMNLTHEPNNTLLLCNYAHFLKEVVGETDLDSRLVVTVQNALDWFSLSQGSVINISTSKVPVRAEECFKRAVQVEPPDAEALCQYAIFLWKVKNDLWGAEERYQQAVAAEPRNSYYRCTYANFLWSTGGEETCFLPSSTSSINNKKGEEV
ncbi:hypothetical protein KY290_026718 [Solanum tuberosum]|uniref:Binding protein n=1 Tax=Solanum tuberosum TaxID=4113 RepID=A0ABQ7UY89_SOLTU|nr:hypothetical protein KY289_024618 [Solanum tuberosum]KAH0756448.1 hypothetical protein KY290_026718 [Solanum tuberosum]